MLEENKALRMRLHSLTICRGLLEDPVVSRLAALLHAQPSDAEACADAYCAFAAALYERGGDLSTYLLKACMSAGRRPVRRFPPSLRNACNTSFAFCRSFPNLMVPPCAAR